MLAGDGVVLVVVVVVRGLELLALFALELLALVEPEPFAPEPELLALVEPEPWLLEPEPPDLDAEREPD